MWSSLEAPYWLSVLYSYTGQGAQLEGWAAAAATTISETHVWSIARVEAISGVVVRRDA